MRDNRAPAIHIVDDDADVRDSLTFLLRSVGLAVSVYSSAAEFVALYRDDRPGCLLFDVRMPDVSGIELHERLVAEGVRLPVIFMTGFADVPMAVRALQSGAVEFIEKPFNRQELLERVQRVVAAEVARREVDSRWADVGRRLSDLTSRERDVLELVLTGLQNKSIATRLDITERTVELRRASLLRKLEVHSTVELVRLLTEFEIYSESRKSASGPGGEATFPPTKSSDDPGT
ncbi:MAG: response regulator [Planctomycetaceae bacterium]|nr:response regulator [Planctomycetaceae bacterium]